MQKKYQKIIEIIGVLLVLSVGVAYFSLIKTGDDAMFEPYPLGINDLKNINNDLDQVKVTMVYSDGSHSIKGFITVPSPCHEITNDVTIAESYPEQVSINLQVINSGGVCAQVLTDKEFEVLFEASELANIQASINYVPVNFVE